MEKMNMSETESTNKNELILFLLDGSGSMRQSAEMSNQDGPTKSDVLNDIVCNVLKRIAESQASNMFRIGIIRFGSEPIIEQFDGESYFTVENAIKVIKPSIQGFANTEVTDIVKAFEIAGEITNEFYADDDLARDKHCTLILFTDGKHYEHESNIDNRREELLRLDKSVKIFKAKSISPRVACVSLGSDAEIDALIGISTMPDNLQEKRFETSQLKKYLKTDDDGNYKLCIVGHKDDNIGRDEANTIRRFLIIGTKTDSR